MKIKKTNSHQIDINAYKPNYGYKAALNNKVDTGYQLFPKTQT